jgi:hypothetical protein
MDETKRLREQIGEQIRQQERMHAEKYVLPVVARLDIREEWDLDVKPGDGKSGHDDPVFSFKQGKHRAYRSTDAFTALQEFLNIRTPVEAGVFFKKYGPFQYEIGSDGVKTRSARPAPASLSWTAIQKVVEDVKTMLFEEEVPVHLYRFFFDQPLKVELSFRSINYEGASRLYPKEKIHECLDDAAVAVCHDVVDALRASIFLSLKHDFRWKRCGRTGCDVIFEHTTKHKRVYCCQECARWQAVTDYNARKKNKSTHPKSKTTKRPSK